jgi:formiminoglutamase
LGKTVRRWDGSSPPTPARSAIIGFASDEGTRRNLGRPGAAQAPHAIREFLYRLTAYDSMAQTDLAAFETVDMGNLTVGTELEAAQQALAAIVGRLLRDKIVPVILGGGHETAFADYLGYAAAGIECAIINIDAHLDVRPYPQGPHSGSPFRQAMEHAGHPLRHGRYVVIGAQRQSCARSHVDFVEKNEGRIHWLDPMIRSARVIETFELELDRLGREAGTVMVTVDADAFRQADVPGCSAPSPLGLDGAIWPEIAIRAGTHPAVRSIDIVEVNPSFDRDGQTARWAAIGIRQFLVGLAQRKTDASTS